MRFIDLFAGLGGFHLALRRLGHECVFASEIDNSLRNCYEKNFGIFPAGDLREIDAAEIPHHEILCAGFPCQPFSKAGRQSGLKDPELGELYLHIIRVIKYHRPHYVILENVPNLALHDNGQTWRLIKTLLRGEGYDVRINRLSPHQFGVPQIRDRIYIVASLVSLHSFKWPTSISTQKDVSIHSVLDTKPEEARPLSEQVKRCLAVWQEFLDQVPRSEKIPHPLWSMEFGATYPFDNMTPYTMTAEELSQYRGSHGYELSEATTKEEMLKLLPSHARVSQLQFPKWKIRFIQKNRFFYESHRSWLDNWINKIKTFPSSYQKLEWNCQERDPCNEDRRLDQYVIQIRPSGVRVKRPTTAPSLVAMTATQVPIITWESRYMTTTECKRLQSMEELRYLPEPDSKAYMALGNAVNVRVAELVAEALVGSAASKHREMPAAEYILTPSVRGKALPE